jgi:hypothetical protein
VKKHKVSFEKCFVLLDQLSKLLFVLKKLENFLLIFVQLVKDSLIGKGAAILVDTLKNGKMLI